MAPNEPWGPGSGINIINEGFVPTLNVTVNLLLDWVNGLILKFGTKGADQCTWI